MSEYKGSSLFYRLIRVVLFITYRILFRFRYFGAERVPSETDSRGVILAPNHASYIDPPILGISLKRRVTFLAKEYLFKNFFVGVVLRGIGAYPIKSEKDDLKSIRDLIRLLKAGRCVVVFPEGTRSETGTFKEPESGIGFLAAKSRCVVVPVYVAGSFEAYPKGAKKIKATPVQVYYGKPFVPAEETSLMDSQDPYGAISREIMARIVQIKAEVDSAQRTRSANVVGPTGPGPVK